MRVFFALCMFLLLTACGGGSGSSDDDANTNFSTDDLIGKAFLSKSLLDTRSMTADDDGQILLFSADSIREIDLSKYLVIYNDSYETLESESEYIDRPWTLTDGKLEVVYPGDGTCITSKLDDRNSEVDIQGVCTDANDGSIYQDEDTVVRPLALDASSFYGRDVTLVDEGIYEHWKFNSDNTFEYFKTYDPDETNDVIVGSVTDSEYENVVRVDFPADNDYYNTPDYGLFIQLTANILVFVTFDENEVLDNVRFIQGINGANWFVDDYFLGYNAYTF